jgi:bifunctional ADP-heptose synthase (sugar kinase/adenylyltransferase)/phosphoglycolate phosphatase-like HAD superfamily hydrolase
MKQTELKKLLSDIRRARVAVIGDFCLDAYWVEDPALSEVSIETGLATRAVASQRYSLGGAGNVIANLAALGVGGLKAFGVVGGDPFAGEMLTIMAGLGVDTGGMLTQKDGWSTAVYVKPHEAGMERNRIDFGNANRLDPGVGEALAAAFSASLGSLDLVIVNQQLLHGIHTPDTRASIAALIAAAGIPFICDSRAFSDSFPGALRKVNDREALRLCGVDWKAEDPVPLSILEPAVHDLAGRWGTSLFITRGGRGILVCDRGSLHEVPGLEILGRIDTVGAGDSALAGIAAALAVGRDPVTAATLGNLAAGVTVQKLFITGTASPEEVMAIGADPDYVYRPELAADPRSARLQEGCDVEIVSAPPGERRITHAIFDHDGTVSTLREGWEGVMEPMMVRSILGPAWKSAEERIYRAAVERVREYVDKTTGVQTLVQMEGLVEMVREFAIVPPGHVKDPAGYKAEYNAELLALVGARAARLTGGELSLEDFTMKGAVDFLRALDSAGVILHLASGTDTADVKAEARLLGYDTLFRGGIHGAVGDARVEAKKVVLDRILDEVGDAAGVVTFGDGPVEIRETRKRGGYAVGVASDELRRFGWNHRKRARVVRAGADLVIPDFSQWRRLLAMFRLPRPAGVLR